MELTRIIGDVHGLANDYRRLINQRPSNVFKTIQLGDMGVGFGQSDYWQESLNQNMINTNSYFIRGNHDHPDTCKLHMSNYIDNGLCFNDCFAVNGAWSIDNPNAPPGWWARTEGVNWWPDEECSVAELIEVVNEYSAVLPRIMITHDCPRQVASEMFFKTGFIKGPEYPTRTAQALQSMSEIHQPAFHFFGHWHKSMMYVRGKTTYVCLNELDYIDIELDDDDQIQDAITKKFA